MWKSEENIAGGIYTPLAAGSEKVFSIQIIWLYSWEGYTFDMRQRVLETWNREMAEGMPLSKIQGTLINSGQRSYDKWEVWQILLPIW